MRVNALTLCCRSGQDRHSRSTLDSAAAESTEVQSVGLEDLVKQEQQSVVPEGATVPEAVHVGISRDVTGMGPIVGARYTKIGEDYNLCQEAFDRLPEAEAQRFMCIETPARASEIWQEALRIDPQCKVAWYNLGNSCKRGTVTGRSYSEKECFQEALRIDP